MTPLEHGLDLPRYRSWAPSPYDTHGLGLPERQDWLVLPVMRTRDSDPLEESNFAACERILTDAGAEHEVHRFSHWGPGWFEIYLVHPDAAEVAGTIACRLADYPVLDEHDFSEREHECAYESWHTWGAEACRLALREAFELSDTAAEALDADLLWGQQMSANVPYEVQGHGDTQFRFDWVDDVSRAEVAELIRKSRKERG